MSELTGPVLFASTFSVFFATLLHSEPWSRTIIAFAYSLYVVVYGLSGPLIGRWCESFGPKRVMLAGGISIAGGFALLGATRQAWQFCAVYGLLGVTAGMTGIVPLTTLVFRWFPANPGLAIGVASSGTLGGLFLAPLAYTLNEHLGWRGAYPALGSAGLLLFGVILATVENAPAPVLFSESGSTAGGSPPTLAHVTSDQPTTDDLRLPQALATQRFWLLAVSGFLFLSALAALLAHAVPLAQDRGIAGGTAAFALGLIVGLGPIGRIGFGHLADRYQSKRVLALTYLLQAAALVLLISNQGARVFWAFVVIYAVSHGGALAVAPVVVGDLFGRTSLASLVGAYWLVATAGSLVGPPLAAAVRQGVGSYYPVLTVFALSTLCAAGLTGMIREQAAPVRRPLFVSTHRAT
jgi:MFS family permease